jgi:hypothetical protein
MTRTSAAALALLLAACQAPLGATDATVIQADTSEWQCPPGQSCEQSPDYRALLSHAGKQQLYLSFAGSLAAPYSAEALNRHFRFGDIYRPTDRGTQVIHIDNTNRGEASIEFAPTLSGRLNARVMVRRYRLQLSSKADEKCQLDDIKGLCLHEQKVDASEQLVLDLALPAAKP